MSDRGELVVSGEGRSKSKRAGEISNRALTDTRLDRAAWERELKHIDSLISERSHQRRPQVET